MYYKIVRSNDHPLSQKDFDSIYARVPRLTVEVIIKNKTGEVCLTLRDIEPCKGVWHLPGGTVRMGELLLDAVKRVALREVGIRVEAATQNGYIEYPSHFNDGVGYPVGIVFEVTKYTGTLQSDSEATECGWFSQLPSKMHPDQDVFLVDNGYLRK